MKKLLILLLVFLAGCATQLPPIIAPTATVITVSDLCAGTNEEGARCLSNCDCSKPLDCIKKVCRQIKLDDGGLCAQNAQCKSGFCTESSRCGGPDGPNSTFSCKKRFGGNNANPDGYTVCGFGTP